MTWLLEGVEDEADHFGSIEQGGRQRSAIGLVRKSAQIRDPEVRAAVGGLVKMIMKRGG